MDESKRERERERERELLRARVGILKRGGGFEKSNYSHWVFRVSPNFSTVKPKEGFCDKKQ